MNQTNDAPVRMYLVSNESQGGNLYAFDDLEDAMEMARLMHVGTAVSWTYKAGQSMYCVSEGNQRKSVNVRESDIFGSEEKAASYAERAKAEKEREITAVIQDTDSVQF